MPYTEMIEHRLRFMEIDKDVIAELQNAKQLIEPQLDHMLEKFYAHIMDEPDVKLVFADDSTIERAQSAQKAHWLQTLFDGKFKSTYFDKVERIGRSHARVGLTPNWYIGGYCKMLVQFVAQVAQTSQEQGRDAGPMIEALCKAVLLDLDLVIHCYLTAKDETMLDILERTTNFSNDMEILSGELSAAMAEVKASTEALSTDANGTDQYAGQLATLGSQIDALSVKMNEVDERISKLKTSDRLYLHKGSDQTGTFARIRTLFRGR